MTNAAPDYTAARAAVADMMHRTEAAQRKFAAGTAQFTLQKNRLHALSVARDLLARAETGDDMRLPYTKQDLERAVAPLASLISKSEKAKTKLAPDSWQENMLAANLSALHLALPLLDNALAGLE